VGLRGGPRARAGVRVRASEGEGEGEGEGASRGRCEGPRKIEAVRARLGYNLVTWRCRCSPIKCSFSGLCRGPSLQVRTRSERVRHFGSPPEPRTGLRVRFTPHAELRTGLGSGSARFRSEPKFRTELQHHYVVGALLESVDAGLRAIPLYGHLALLFPNCTVFTYLFQLSKHWHLPRVRAISNFLSSFINIDEFHSTEALYFTVRKNGPAVKKVFEWLMEEAQPLILHTPTPSHSAAAFAAWHETYPSQQIGHALTLCMAPLNSNPPPFIQGVLSQGNQHLFSAGIQLTT